MENLIGRQTEKRLLDEIFESPEAELLAVYGRRRVGKTYLIKHYFQNRNCLYFNLTGIKKGALKLQLSAFSKAFAETFYPNIAIETPKNWMQAFEMLTQAIADLPKRKKIVFFFDELPWLAHRKSGVLQALEYYWNRVWSDDRRLKLIVCGSASAWMLSRIIRNRAGLHNRVTRKLRLMPFTLSETETFLSEMGFRLSRKQVLKLYMTIGGIPYYLKQLNKRLSVDQNINQLFFRSDGLFFDEFDEIFFSLFEDAECYQELVELIAASKSGVFRNDLEKQNRLTGKGGYLSKRLRDLETSGFITSYLPFSHKRRGTCYRLTDMYCHFHLTWIAPIKARLKHEKDSMYWMSVVQTPKYFNWAGYAFENICYQHLSAIRKGLHIEPSALSSPWHYLPIKGGRGAQIDLLFDRMDNAVTLCEIKYTDKCFTIDKQYAAELLNKQQVFRSVTKTEKQIFLAIISANGLTKNAYANVATNGVVTIDHLFAS